MSEKMPLILLPAFMSTHALWGPQIEPLADIAEITVVELTPYDTVVKMAEAVLDQAPERFALAGLSLGGFTAFEIMRRAPERIERLALISTSARGDAPERLEARKTQIEAVRAGRFDQVVAGFLKIMQSPSNPWSAEVFETVQQMIHEAGTGCFLRQQNAMMNRPDLRDRLAQISCPTFVIHGREDQSWPLEVAEEVAAAIPTAQLRVIDNCGHFTTLDQPEQTTALLRDWLLG